MSRIFANQKVVVLASESTEGADEVDAILQDGDRDIYYQDMRESEIINARAMIPAPRQRNSASGTRHKSVPNVANVTLTGPFSARLSASSGDEAPPYAAVLKAANFTETIDSGVDATYEPSTVPQNSMTIYEWSLNTAKEHRLRYATGVRGNIEWTFEVGTEAYWTFTGNGIYGDYLTDSAQFFDATSGEVALLKDGASAVTERATGVEQYVDAESVVCRGITVTVNGNTWEVSAISLGTNWTVELIENMTGDNRVDQVLLSRADEGSRMGGSFTLNTDDDTVIDDFISLFEAATEFAITIVLSEDDGGTGDSTITISASKVQIGEPSDGTAGNFRTFEIPFLINGDWSDLVADDELSIVYGEAA